MSNYNQLIRLTKISKLSKLVRMTRLARLLKIVKNQKKLVSQVSEKLSLNAGWDRLILLTTFFFFFLHLSSCIFLVITQLEDSRTLFFTPYLPLSDYELYVLSTYFIMTTITTVGYGDVKAETAVERVYAMLVMAVGVSFFTLLSGALASIMTAHDN